MIIKQRPGDLCLLMLFCGLVYGGVSTFGHDWTKLAVPIALTLGGLSTLQGFSLCNGRLLMSRDFLTPLYCAILIFFPTVLCALVSQERVYDDSRFTYGIIESVLGLTFLWIGTSIKFVRGTKYFNQYFFVGLFIFVTICICWILEGFPDRFKYFANHKNLLAAASFLVTILICTGYSMRLISHRIFYFSILMALFIAAISGGRSVTIITIILILISFIPRKLDKFKVAFIGLILIYTFPIIYVCLSKMEEFTGLRKIVLNASGHLFDTGRVDRWLYVLTLIDGNEIFGLGYVYQEYYSDKVMHTHNMFLSRLFTTGVFGLLTSIVFFSIIAIKLDRHSNLMGQALLLAILLHQTLENNLFCGGIPVGATLAVSLGIIATNLGTSRTSEKTNVLVAKSENLNY